MKPLLLQSRGHEPGSLANSLSRFHPRRAGACPRCQSTCRFRAARCPKTVPPIPIASDKPLSITQSERRLKKMNCTDDCGFAGHDVKGCRIVWPKGTQMQAFSADWRQALER